MTATATGQLDLGLGRLGRQFNVVEDRLVQELRVGDRLHRSSVSVDQTSGDLLGDWWHSYLRGCRPVAEQTGTRPIRTLELFSGSGGLASGFRQACLELGIPYRSEAAADQDVGAVAVYQANHECRRVFTDSVSSLVDSQVRGLRGDARFNYPPEIARAGWKDLVGSVDVVLAGPPCQGHSNLNNRTRRVDKRNELYLTVPAIAIAVEAPIVIIENVPAVVHDRLGVVASTVALLEQAGYCVTTSTIHAAKLGWAQRRSRYFLVARRDTSPLPLEEVVHALSDEARSVMWAIGDLEYADDDLIGSPIDMSSDNLRRIDWLFDHDEYDLPLSERPECHQDGTSYMSVYGRMRAQEPAPTITTGFMTPGRGRFIHPTRRRVLSFREAARLQGFPDTYRFVLDPDAPPSKRSLGKWIGDAVPMPLGYAAALAALGPGWT